jgi:hypothetical protein
VNVGKGYRLPEFLAWTRRELYVLLESTQRGTHAEYQRRYRVPESDAPQSWMYTTLEQVGASTENPFEGGANDVPMAQVNRTVEIELRELLGDTDLPEALQAKNNIVL